MKITKKQYKVLSIGFILILAILCGIIIVKLDFSILQSILLVLAIPTITVILLYIIKPILLKIYATLAKKLDSEKILQIHREQNIKRGLKNWKNAKWNLEGIEIWALKEDKALSIYNSIEGKKIRKRHLPYYINKQLNSI
ncbi:hypothetical protein [Abyssalbus ytuae]|uniref:Uncharacterized protein n=1 Tax=Abyssalbus ytuae TaxID=2926907 RepID=A0A9E7A2J6_9FLAO|nr:hypothetical protein [Abyssalbus ytuae]UOB18606.1 hypothetical protein MQE35_04780 [Abyssalbus ytuae]